MLLSARTAARSPDYRYVTLLRAHAMRETAQNATVWNRIHNKMGNSYVHVLALDTPRCVGKRARAQMGSF